MTELFPKNLFNDLDIVQEHQTDDFIATLHYVLHSVASDRDVNIMLARYMEDKTLEEIGNMFGITRQRVQIIVQATLDKMKGTYCDMLKVGLKKYCDNLLISRIDSMRPFLAEEERKKLVIDSYTEGYNIGYADGENENLTQNIKPLHLVTIDSLDISVRSRNSLVRGNVHTLGDLINCGDTIIDFASFGKGCFHEMANLLTSYGVKVKSVFPRACKKFDWSEENG